MSDKKSRKRTDQKTRPPPAVSVPPLEDEDGFLSSSPAVPSGLLVLTGEQLWMLLLTIRRHHPQMSLADAVTAAPDQLGVEAEEWKDLLSQATRLLAEAQRVLAPIQNVEDPVPGPHRLVRWMSENHLPPPFSPEARWLLQPK